ncbi:MAG: LysR family transcriptional regulator [Lachnospiraceae bacterium]|nr:LysR family transcriptional regulator [Lachnospiraceae bacterium]
MTLQNLKYVIEISACQSFSGAAKKLFVSQSTLSTAVKEIEEDLGICLFNRTNRGVTLTYDGEDFIRYAREIVEQAAYLEQRYHSRKSIPMRFSVSSQRFPFAVRAFTSMLQDTDSQNYDMAIRECDTNSVIHDVSSSRSELGIMAIYEPHMRSMQMLFTSYDIEFREIALLNNYVFFRSGHPLESKEKIYLKDLEDYPFVTYDQETETSHFSEEPLFYKILNKNVHVSDRCTKIALVRKTDCFSIGPDLTNSNADAFHKGLNSIVARPLEDELSTLHLGYIMRKGQVLSSLGKQYLKFLEKDVREIHEILSGSCQTE